MSMKKGQYIKRLRHCGLDPQSPENKEMLKQVQHDAMRHFAVDTTRNRKILNIKSHIASLISQISHL